MTLGTCVEIRGYLSWSVLYQDVPNWVFCVWNIPDLQMWSIAGRPVEQTGTALDVGVSRDPYKELSYQLRITQARRRSTILERGGGTGKCAAQERLYAGLE